MESSFFELVVNVERYLEESDPVAEELLRRHFELSQADCEAVLAWLALRGFVALRTSNAQREVTHARQSAVC